MSRQSSNDFSDKHAVHSKKLRPISIATYCQDALHLKANPDCSPECYKIVTSFLVKNQQVASDIWLSLPAATDMVRQEVYCQHPLPEQRITPRQLPQALQTVLSVLLQQAQTGRQSQLGIPAEQTVQQSDSLSATESMLRGLLLVLHLLAIINHKLDDQQHTVAASVTLVQLCGQFMGHLTDEQMVLKQIQALPSVNNTVLNRVIQAVLPILRQTIKHRPGSAVIFMDVLLQLSAMASSAQDIAQAIIAHGGLTLLVVGFTSTDKVADRTANYLAWLCTHDEIPLVTRLHISALLNRMSAFTYLADAVAPPSLVHREIHPKHVPLELSSQLQGQSDMIQLMRHLLSCQKNYSGLGAEAAVHRALAIAAEDKDAAHQAADTNAPTCYLDEGGKLVMDLRISRLMAGPSTQTLLGQPKQPRSAQQRHPQQSRKATAAQCGLQPGQQIPEFAFPKAPRLLAANWMEVERIAIKAWTLYIWSRSQGANMGGLKKEALQLELSVVKMLSHLLVDYMPMRHLDMDNLLMNLRPVLLWHNHMDKDVSAFCCAMLSRLRQDFAKRMTAQPTCSVLQACATDSGVYDCEYIWHLISQTWGNERDMHHTDQASFVAAINTLYTAMASPMHCHSFLNSQALVDSVLEDAAVPHGPSANYSKVPHYVAVLLQVCQVELQLGSSNFYSLLCKTGLLERSLIAAGAMFMMSQEEAHIWADNGVLVIMARFLWRLSQLLDRLPGTQLPVPMNCLKMMASNLIDCVLFKVTSFLEAKLGAPGVNLQFIACGLLFIAAVRRKLNLMGEVVKPRRVQQTCLPDFDEREMLCYLYDEMGAWKLSNGSSFCTNDADINGTARAQMFQSSFPGLSSAIARADAAWDKGVHDLISAGSNNPLSNSLPDYTLPMSLASCIGSSDRTRSAALSADEEDQSMCKLAGLPRLHASSFEVLCVNGLCTVASTNAAWTCIEEHIYIQAVRFLVGYNTAWLMQDAHPLRHPHCDILQLESHVRLIGRAAPHHLHSQAASNLAAAEAGNAIVLMLILVLKMLKNEQRKQVPAAEPKRHSKSRLGRPARGHPADLTARADGQADVQMVVDGTCADTVCMTLATLKQLLDVVLETLRIIKEHPVWEGIVRKAYETSKVDAPLQQLTQELADAETAGILSNSHVIPIKQVYTDWLGLQPVPCEQPAVKPAGPTEEELRAKAAARKAKKQRQKAIKQQHKASKPQLQQAQRDDQADADQMQHAGKAEQAQQNQDAANNHCDHDTQLGQDVLVQHQQPPSTSGPQASPSGDAALCSGLPAMQTNVCSRDAAGAVVQQGQEPGPTSPQPSSNPAAHQIICSPDGNLPQPDGKYALECSQVQTDTQQAEKSASHSDSDDAFLQQMVCCPITQEAFVDPVIAADGHTYERIAIEAWLEEYNTSPMNGSQLTHKRLVPNLLVKHMVALQ